MKVNTCQITLGEYWQNYLLESGIVIYLLRKIGFEYSQNAISIFLLGVREATYLFDATALVINTLEGQIDVEYLNNIYDGAQLPWEEAKQVKGLVYFLKN